METVSLQEKIDKAFLTEQDGRIYRRVIDDTEKMLIEKALLKSHGNQISAAKMLGLNRNTLRAKIRKLKIHMESYRT